MLPKLKVSQGLSPSDSPTLKQLCKERSELCAADLAVAGAPVGKLLLAAPLVRSSHTLCVSAQRLLFVIESKKDTPTGSTHTEGGERCGSGPTSLPALSCFLARKTRQEPWRGTEKDRRTEGQARVEM